MKFINMLRQPYLDVFEGEGGDSDFEETEAFEEETYADETEETETETEPEPPKHKIKYNGEEKELTVDELVTYAQKGMNYDHVKTELDALREETGVTKKEIAEITKALKSYGYEGTPTEIAEVIMAQARELPVEDYRAERAAEQARINELIENDPRYAKILETERQIQNQAIFNADFLELKRLFPTETAVKLEDIKNFDKFAEARAKNLSVEESYFLANRDAFIGKKAKPKANGEDKDHLQALGGNSGSSVDVPVEIMAEYKKLMPKLTSEEIRAHYNKNL